MELELVLPSPQYYSKITEYKAHIIKDNSSWEGTGCLRAYSVEQFIQNCEDWHNGENIPHHFVPSTQFLCVRKSDNKIVGMVNIRHTIDQDYLRQYGGHISYGILPSEQHKGYGKQILYLALNKCTEMGIKKVLITCKTKNIASQKCIIANGGKFESKVCFHTETDVSIPLNRYWIDTQPHYPSINQQ